MTKILGHIHHIRFLRVCCLRLVTKVEEERDKKPKEKQKYYGITALELHEARPAQPSTFPIPSEISTLYTQKHIDSGILWLWYRYYVHKPVNTHTNLPPIRRFHRTNGKHGWTLSISLFLGISACESWLGRNTRLSLFYILLILHSSRDVNQCLVKQ